MTSYLMDYPYLTVSFVAAFFIFHMVLWYKMVGDIREMLQDESGYLSTGRVIYFGTFVVSSAAILILTWKKSLSDAIFVAYLGWPAVAYGASTFARKDVMKATAEKDNAKQGEVKP